jgi:hypothetical protein
MGNSVTIWLNLYINSKKSLNFAYFRGFRMKFTNEGFINTNEYLYFIGITTNSFFKGKYRKKLEVFLMQLASYTMVTPTIKGFLKISICTQ